MTKQEETLELVAEILGENYTLRSEERTGRHGKTCRQNWTRKLGDSRTAVGAAGAALVITVTVGARGGLRIDEGYGYVSVPARWAETALKREALKRAGA
jgi:hypothetical protein